MAKIEKNTVESRIAVPSKSNWWADVRESLRGSHRDFTQGPISTAIILLAIPMVLEMLMESIFAVVDIFFVIKLGADAGATVGITESIITLIYALAMGLGIGASATVARRIGEKDRNGAAHTAAQSLLLGLIVSLAISVVGILFAPNMLHLVGGSPAVVAGGVNYTRIMLGGNLVIVMLFLINAIFRGAGDAAIAMRVLWLANGINIVLGPCLIFGIGPFPALGVTGAAVATTIGRGIGATYALSRLFRSSSRIHIRAEHFRFDFALIRKLVRLSSSATAQIFIGMASWIGLMMIISRFGSDAVSGYTVGIRIVVFGLLPSLGMSNAAATLVGQALGAGDPKRAEDSVWLTCRYNAVFLAIVGTLFVIFASPIIGFFTKDPAIAGYGVSCLRIVSCGFLFYAYGMVLTESFNGAGDTWTPTKVNLFVFWLWEIPMAWFLAIKLGMGTRGVFLSITIAFSTLAVLSAWLFKRGTWKTRASGP